MFIESSTIAGSNPRNWAIREQKDKAYKPANTILAEFFPRLILTMIATQNTTVNTVKTATYAIGDTGSSIPAGISGGFMNDAKTPTARLSHNKLVASRTFDGLSIQPPAWNEKIRIVIVNGLAHQFAAGRALQISLSIPWPQIWCSLLLCGSLAIIYNSNAQFDLHRMT